MNENISHNQENHDAKREEYEKEFGKEIIDRFYAITPDEVLSTLETIEANEETGIKIHKLDTNENIELYAALIPKKVNPHVHMKGLELYRIISGKGVMNLQSVTSEMFAGDTKPEFKADEIIGVEKDSVFEVKAGVGHSLETIKSEDDEEQEPLILIFACPKSHMITTGEEKESILGDRSFFNIT